MVSVTVSVTVRGMCRLVAIYTPLILITIMEQARGRELRPSDHGLEYQNSAAPEGGKSPPEMKSFFGGGGGGGAGGSSPTSTSSNVAMPNAMNSNSTTSTDTNTWWGNGNGNGKKEDHVRDVLLVASVACGITGVALLVVSALVYVFKFRRQRPSAPPPPTTTPLPSTRENEENKLQIVVRDS